MALLTIGKIAKLANVGVETVRFYEREGLIEKPPRSASGYRQYSDQAVTRLCFIRRAKELGFSLKEIKELLTLRAWPSTTCDDIRLRAEAKIKKIKEKIFTLKRINKALEKLVAACHDQGPVSECPILEAMDEPLKIEGDQ